MVTEIEQRFRRPPKSLQLVQSSFGDEQVDVADDSDVLELNNMDVLHVRFNGDANAEPAGDERSVEMEEIEVKQERSPKRARNYFHFSKHITNINSLI